MDVKGWVGLWGVHSPLVLLGQGVCVRVKVDVKGWVGLWAVHSPLVLLGQGVCATQGFNAGVLKMTWSMHDKVLGKGFQLLGYESQFIFKFRTPCCGPYSLPDEHLTEPLGQTTFYPSNLCIAYPFWSTGLCAPSHLLVQIFLYW